MVTINKSVLLIANGLDIGRRHGGAEVFAAELAVSLHAAGWITCLALLVRTGSEIECEWASKLEKSGAQVIFLNPGPKNNFLTSLRSLLKFCHQRKISIINSHCQIGSLLTLFVKAAQQIKAAVRTVHISLEWGDGWIAWCLRNSFSYFIFPVLFDLQVTVSQSLQNQVKHYPGTKLFNRPVIYIPNALSTRWFENDQEEKISWAKKSGGPIIGTIGQLHPRKGQRFLIKAFSRVISSYPESRLWIIGDGPDRINLERLIAQSGLKNQVKLWGPRQDIRELLQQIDLFVLPSFFEGLPTVIMESMALKVPVIASDIPGNRELVEDGKTGWLVRPGDESELAGMIQKVLDDYESVPKVVDTAKMQLNHYKLSEIVLRYQEVYASVLSKKGAF